jgi:hypothetical protein
MNRKILIIGLCFHLLAAVFSIGFNNHDEHFQILEFAALKLNLAGVNDMPMGIRLSNEINGAARHRLPNH